MTHNTNMDALGFTVGRDDSNDPIRVRIIPDYDGKGYSIIVWGLDNRSSQTWVSSEEFDQIMEWRIGLPVPH